jgi:hypothetical protein
MLLIGFAGIGFAGYRKRADVSVITHHGNVAAN